jgi:Fur family ferric uptake transcriptional regulator
MQLLRIILFEGLIFFEAAMDKEQARQLIKDHGLRVTGPRLAVVLSLANLARPISYSEVLSQLGDRDWDDATIFRNLVKLKEAGIAPVVSRAEGIDRYALAGSRGEAHKHPHFSCDVCGRVACLPEEMKLSFEQQSAWSPSIKSAAIQLSGACPDCIEEV